MQNQRTELLLRAHLAIATAAGFVVLWSYLREPSEPGSAVLFGYSALRLGLVSAVLLVLFILLGFLFASLRGSVPVRTEERLKSLARRPGWVWVVILGIAVSYTLLFSSDPYLGALASYRQRLFPLLLWLALLLAQSGFVLLVLRGIDPEAQRGQRRVIITAAAVLLLFGLVITFIAATGIGLTPDPIYWQEPGTPILFHQALLAAFAGILFYFLLQSLRSRNFTRLELLTFVGLWALASAVWLSQPAKLTHFSLEPAPPNDQVYPFSDALLYDHTARAYLAGQPIPSDFWTKPLYSFSLAVLHTFAGGNYALLTILQVILLALIPGMGFLLGARLGNRPAGLILGLLLILRERNALALSNVIEVSHVKLLLSDVFAMGLMVLMLFLFFHWLEAPGERRLTPLVLGGTLSLLVLTRGHPILLLPFLLFGVLLVPISRPRLRWEAVGLTLLGFVLPLLPWVWRNYQFTGTLAFQYPVSPYSAQMSTSYSFTPGTFDPANLLPRNAGESDVTYYQRLQGQALEFARAHPDEVIRFVSAHYFHNAIFSYLYLPYSFRIEDLNEYVRREPFWQSWQAELSGQAKVLLFINLSLVALGIGSLWRRHGYLALVPLLLGMGYNLSISVGRISGWRFILPADWITLVYYSAGIMYLFHLLRSFVSAEAQVDAQKKTATISKPLRGSTTAATALFFLGLSLALTQGHQLFSGRYPSKSAEQLWEEYRMVTDAAFISHFDAFLKADTAVIAYGQAHNPSFRPADEEELDSSWPVYVFWPSYKPRSYPRLIFNLLGPTPAGVILPMDSPPDSFAEGAEVIVIGCLAKTGEIIAQDVVLQSPSAIHYVSELLMTSCPPAGED